MAVKFITKESLYEANLERRRARADRIPDAYRRAQVMEMLASGKIPTAQFSEDFDIRKHVRVTQGGEGVIGEFIGTGNFAQQFYERQRYEVDAGRDEEPLLYPALYSITIDTSLPRLIPINVLGPAGVVFQRVLEGGEVKFSHVGQSAKSVEIIHWATGIEYTEDLFIYNELWRLSNIDRQFGVASNALENHIHLSPILNANYTSANQTSAATDGATLVEKYLRTIEKAVTASSTDKKNPRRGPYMLLVSSADAFTVERALNRVPQEGFDLQSSVLRQVRTVLAYDGWTGMRGHKEETYPGVGAGKAYLIHMGHRQIDFQSYFKHGLRIQMGEKDTSRFILAQTIYDVRMGAFADPLRSVEEITWPTS